MHFLINLEHTVKYRVARREMTLSDISNKCKNVADKKTGDKTFAAVDI